MNNKAEFVKAILLSTCMLVPSIAYAQTASTQSSEDPGSSGQLQDIIVTANRREESLQNVPVTVSVLSAESLRRENIVSNQDLAGRIPSLVVGQSSGQRSTQSFTLRGQGSTYGGGPGVAAYFAEVPVPSASDTVAQLGTETLFYDLQSVQVLKGPQGTLFGRNTTGGAVLLEPQRPKNELGGYLAGQIGNYASKQVEGVLNVPLVEDKLLLRVAGRFTDRAGYTRDAVTNRDYDDRHYWATRVGLTWTPTSTIENYLMFAAYKSDTHGTGSVINAFNTAQNSAGQYLAAVGRLYGKTLLDQVVAEQQARGPRRTELNGTSFDKSQMWSVTDTLKIELSDNLTLRNIASFARYKTSTDFDLDGSRLNVSRTTSGNWNSTDARQWTEELQLQGRSLDNQLTYTTGIYHEDVKPLGTEFRGAFTPNAGNITEIYYGEKRKSTGIYAQAALDFGALSETLSGLRLTGGARYTKDKRDSFYRYIVNDNCLIAGATLPSCFVGTKINSDAVTWTVGLDYHVTPAVLVFAKASKGYKAGGFNFNGTNPLALTFRPEEVITYEGGIKSQFHLGSVPIRLNGAYYYTDYSHIQRIGSTTVIRPDGGISPGSATVNAGSAHIQGFEIEGTIIPFEGLNLSGGYSYMSGKYDKFSFNYLVGSVVTVDDRSGVPFAFAPRNQFSVSASYTIDAGTFGEIVPSATFSHVDRYYTQISMPIEQPGGSEPYGYLPASDLLNMRVEWKNANGLPLDVSFFMTNVANKTFPVQLQSTFGKNGANFGQGVSRYVYSEPRMYGVQVRWRFGGEK